MEEEFDEQLPPKVEKEMSFLEHLEELRWHVIRALLAIVVLRLLHLSFVSLSGALCDTRSFSGRFLDLYHVL
jgi:Sec-independent protein secretion pathway component TatC